jgi:hypothetical protein
MKTDFSPEARAKGKASQRNHRYIRQFPKIINKKTGRPEEYEIPKSMALYILDGNDREARLNASSRDLPCTSYTGQSRVWREEHATNALKQTVAVAS